MGIVLFTFLLYLVVASTDTDQALPSGVGFVTAYSIQAIVWLFVYCTPYSGWWEFQWMNPFDPRCRDFTLFVNLVYWNICESPLSIGRSDLIAVYNTDAVLFSLPSDD